MKITGVMKRPDGCERYSCVFCHEGYHDNPSVCMFHNKFLEGKSKNSTCEYKTTISQVKKMLKANGKEQGK